MHRATTCSPNTLFIAYFVENHNIISKQNFFFTDFQSLFDSRTILDGTSWDDHDKTNLSNLKL